MPDKDIILIPLWVYCDNLFIIKIRIEVAIRGTLMSENSSLVEQHIRDWMQKDGSSESDEAVDQSYRRYVARKWIFMALCIVAAIITVGLALTIGTYKISFLETYSVIWDHITGNVTDVVADEVIFDLRMPRILAGIFAGAGLAVAGACMQSILKNPLADPFTTGVSAGASLGATLAIIAGVSIGGMGVVSNAFVFALIPTAIMVGKWSGRCPNPASPPGR